MLVFPVSRSKVKKLSRLSKKLRRHASARLQLLEALQRIGKEGGGGLGRKHEGGGGWKREEEVGGVRRREEEGGGGWRVEE